MWLFRASRKLCPGVTKPFCKTVIFERNNLYSSSVALEMNKIKVMPFLNQRDWVLREQAPTGGKQLLEFMVNHSWKHCFCCPSLVTEIPFPSYANPDNGIPPGSLGFPNGSAVKNLPPMQETRVWSLGQEDPLEKERATHSSILAWEIPGTEEPGGPQSTGLQRLRNNWANKRHH